MRIRLNGAMREFTDATTIAAMLKELGLSARKVAVERNMAIVSRSTYDAVHLRDGDRIEIVHFIGGGA